MKTDVIVIGAGLSGLAAASLLAKRGLKVTVVEHTFKPGGSCGIFKRNGAIFDQGSAMMYGFGKRGFNSHRFIFNALEEPIDVIKNDFLYDVYYKGKRIRFHHDIDKYIDELAQVFPREKNNLKRFYKDMQALYENVIAGDPNFTTPDQTDPKDGLRQVMKHPVSFAKFLSFLNRSTKSVLKAYFKDDEILSYFNKLTSTYCYTDVAETPAVMAAVMFVDNHMGGSFYPKGSTMFVPGKLEKSIEENGGLMLYEKTVTKIIIEDNRAKGVVLDDGSEIRADYVVYSGTVWNLYGKLLDKAVVTERRAKWAARMRASYPSVVMYTIVKKDVIPAGTSPITLFSNDKDGLDDSEVTTYIFSIDEPGLCPSDCHVVTAIGPTYKGWPEYSEGYEKSEHYKAMKKAEEERLLALLESKFPGFRKAVVHKEVSTPLTIEKYAMKNKGSVAGPLQAMGQHMFRRLHIKSEYAGLFCCGESTILGTGTPTVTVSGISAANAILKEKGLERFKFHEGMKDYVKELPAHRPGEKAAPLLASDAPELTRKAFRCEYCDKPSCMVGIELDIRGINRRLSVGNLVGARRLLEGKSPSAQELTDAEDRCILASSGKPVEISEIVVGLKSLG